MRSLAILLLLTAAAAAQPIELVGPDKIDAGDYTQIQVKGLAPDQLPATAIDYEPKESVMLIAAQTWGGEPFLLFVAKKPGSYTITVSLHEWRTDITSGAKKAERAKIANEDLLEIQSLEKRLAEKYPVAQGQLVIQVGEDPDPDPPDPPDPPLPPSGDIAKAVTHLAGQVTGGTRNQEAQNLAAVYEALAAEVMTANDPLSKTKLATPTLALQQATRDLGQVLGGRRTAWESFAVGLDKVMNKQFEDGKLPNTIFGVAEGFQEIAKGLRSVK